MAQHDYVIANGTGAAVRSDLNNALAAIVSNNSGATEPTTTYAYQWWADTSTGLLKLRNAANNAWITLRELDGTLTIEAGTVSAPGLAFASDLNTGVWSPGADQFAIATNGVERVEWGTSEVVFNDGGANYDFRIEGDTNSSLFFVDASAEAVGIGTTSPTFAAGGGVQASFATFSSFRATSGSNTGTDFAAASDGKGYVYVRDNADLLIGTNNTERARVDSSGRLLVGTSTSYNVGSTVGATLQAVATGSVLTGSFTRYTNDNDGAIISLGKSRGTSAGSFTVVQSGDIIGNIRFAGADGGDLETQAASIRCEVDGTPGANDMPGRLVFSTTADGASSPTERMKIDNTGEITVTNSRSSAGSLIATFKGSSGGSNIKFFEGNSSTDGNAANCQIRVGSTTVTNRSINAGGTVNASGADYAEYMTKAGDFDIAKGGICGITFEGLLTNEYSNAVGFVVKSTNPSYVGGDNWGAGFDDDPVGLEVVRQTVDRIAFAGQVPVNVMGAIPGQYIVPVEAAEGGITGIAKDEADLSLAEYMRAVGKVIAIEDDGRARIIVKIA